jgi:hypothetical protein
VYGPAYLKGYPSQQIKIYFEAFIPLDQLDQSEPTCQILAGPVEPVGPAGSQYVLFNCRWPIKITVKIRAFFEKMALGYLPEKKFCNFKIFF